MEKGGPLAGGQAEAPGMPLRSQLGRRERNKTRQAHGKVGSIGDYRALAHCGFVDTVSGKGGLFGHEISDSLCWLS